MTERTRLHYLVHCIEQYKGEPTPDIVRRYHDALQPWLANPAVRDKFAEQAMTLWPQTPQQLANYVADERRRFEVIVKAAGYTPEAS